MAQNTSSAVMARRVEPHNSLDYFPTLPFATRAFVEHVLKPLGLYRREATVWEPAAGEGHMVRVLSEYFDTVHASDVFDYGVGYPTFDFLSLEPGQLGLPAPFGDEVDWIISNPPFGPASNPRIVRFVLIALAHARVGVAMFGRIQMLEGAKRFNRIWRAWQSHALYAQHVERVPLAKGRILPKEDGSATAYGWLLILKKQQFSPIFPGLDIVAVPTIFIPPCRKRLERDDDYTTPTQGD